MIWGNHNLVLPLPCRGPPLSFPRWPSQRVSHAGAVPVSLPHDLPPDVQLSPFCCLPTGAFHPPHSSSSSSCPPLPSHEWSVFGSRGGDKARVPPCCPLGWRSGVLPRESELGQALCQLHGSTQGLFCSRLLLINVIYEGIFSQDGFEEMTLISISITYKKQYGVVFCLVFCLIFFPLILDISVEQVQNFSFLFLKCGLIPWIKFQHYHTTFHLSCVVLQW